MKHISILALCVFITGCAVPAPYKPIYNYNEAADVESVEEVIDTEVVTTDESLAVDDSLMSEDMSEPDEMAQSAVTIDDSATMENDVTTDDGVATDGGVTTGDGVTTDDGVVTDDETHQLRVEIKELKDIIADFKHSLTLRAAEKSDDSNIKHVQASVKHNQVKVSPVNLVMKFNTRSEREKWWNKLEDLEVKDKFKSMSNGSYMIYLGNFKNHKIAQDTKNKINKATGANNIEMIM
jgi:hypothetical protein